MEGKEEALIFFGIETEFGVFRNIFVSEFKEDGVVYASN